MSTTNAVLENSSGILSKVWNYDCFKSPKKERITIVVLLVIFAISLIISIFGKSSFMGSISGISGLLGGVLAFRYKLKLREEKAQEQAYVISPAELSMTKLNSSKGQSVMAPNKLVDAFGHAKPVYTDGLKIMSPPSEQKGPFMKPISDVCVNLPNFCIGVFNSGQEFIMLKIKQTYPSQNGGSMDNFLLFTGPKNDVNKWVAFHSSAKGDEWGIKFLINNSDDLSKLTSIMTNGVGQLRKPQSNILWTIAKHGDPDSNN